MSRKPLGKDKFGVQKVMRVKDYFGDAMGQFALNSMSTVVGQLTYFYTEKVGMAAGAIATMFIVCKIIDAFTDIIMGNIVDHTKPGKEKYRPWLLKAGIPAGIMMILMFTVPDIGDTGKLVYATITNLLLTAVFYTAMAIPYNSLMTVRTNSQEERGVMGTWRAATGYVAGMIFAIAMIPITNALGGTQSAWIKFGVVMGLLVALASLICYLSSRETATESGTVVEEVTDDEETVPFKEALVKLFHNKYWVIVLVVNLISCIIYGLSSGSGAYYCKYIFGDDNLVAVLGTIGLIPTVLGFVLVGPMIKKLGVVKTLLVSFGLGIAANILLLFTKDNFFCYALFGSINTFATIPMMCLVGVMTAMSIDYNEYKYGVRMVATANSASSFGGKVGSGIGTSLIGWILGAVGHTATAGATPAATRYAIYGFSIVLPLIFFIIMFVLVSKFDLEKTLPAMKEEVAKRKAQDQ
ncbi:MFS transporter [Mediterraneibacter glycyrrhizinilyticus]|uniref:MFS transporter n=1 Tax=Mediterraneibacter glycyrrhizinilyticus TaxID=342942 RepID=UPI002659ABDD|nr:glycoside-pentoside-hexuronide (GPH):cation symporter [Mediterraneibacter glycyrrhizinilyticus]MCF2569343.1 MFS transporter [Mediterraneibacter glycyrrhizinilyticus]